MIYDLIYASSAKPRTHISGLTLAEANRRIDDAILSILHYAPDAVVEDRKDHILGKRVVDVYVRGVHVYTAAVVETVINSTHPN